MVSDSHQTFATKRIPWHSWFVMVSGALSLALGSLIIVAWHVHATALIQVLPGSPPIRYNTALAFVLSGLSLLLLHSRRGKAWVWLPAGLVLAIGGLTLIQYLFKVDLGIDQLLMQDYLVNHLYNPSPGSNPGLTEPIHQFFITIEHPLPGRPSPNTALTFTLVGIALLGLGWPKGNRRYSQSIVATAGILAAGVIAIGAITLLGYATQLSTLYTWRYLTGVSIPTAMGFVLVGIGILSDALGHRPRQSLPRWFPVSMGFGVLMASVFLWQALLSWNQSLSAQLPSLATEVRALLSPVANIVLFQGLLLALLITGILSVDQWLRAKSKTLKQLNEQLASTSSALESILESTADGILVLDQTMHLMHWNSRFVKMWGIPQTIVDEVKRGTGTLNFYRFVTDHIHNPDQFHTNTQHMLKDMESKTFDVVELKDGRIFERYGRPQWQGNRVVAKVLSYRDVTERDRAEAALRESEERYRSLVAALTEGIVLQDADGVIQMNNARAEEILGLRMDQLQGLTCTDPRWRSIREDGSAFPGDQHPAMMALRTGKPCRDRVMGVHKPNGELTWISINSQPIFRRDEEQPYAVVTSFSDITERKRMEEALFYEKELAQVTLHSIGDAVITTDVAGCVKYINPMAETLIGWSQAETEGKPLADIFRLLHDDTRETVENPVLVALRENQIVGLARDTVLIARDGREIGIEDSAGPIRDRKGKTVGAVMVFHDVTQSRQLTRQVFWQAMHDSLTGLVNRHAFEHRLEQAIQNARTYDETHVLFYLDLDQFKIVNDTCGHKVGDELLRQVTALLQTHIRKTDTLARLGGDEFGVLLHQCDLEQGLKVANILRETVQDFRFAWENNAFTIGVSIGVVLITQQSTGLGDLLMAADSACYAAKNNGRNRVHIFQADDQTLLQQQGEIRWTTRITHALNHHRFCLFAQPIIATQSQSYQPDYYEVLLRLIDETGLLIPPMAFIPAAERYGLIGAIDRWVVSTLFQNWDQIQPAADQPPRRYAINLSGTSLTDDRMIDFLRKQFAEHRVPPHLICFEITETAAISNLAKATQFIHQLRDMGCHFALDDFGSGMSSFTYLKHLPVTYLKIDGGFVKDIVDDPVDHAMVEAISHIGQVMGLQTMAEYVENEAILERVTALGVDFAQGYGIAKPSFLLGSKPEQPEVLSITSP